MGEVRIKNLITLSIISFGLFYFFTAQAAASISLSPDQGEYLLKSNFIVKVILNSPESELSQVSASLTFDPTRLRVVNLSINNSDINKWLVEPTYSNNKGRVSFIGILKQDKGNSEERNLLEVTFRAIKLGKAFVQINAGKAIDNQGVNTLAALGSGEFNIIQLPINISSTDQLLVNQEISTADQLTAGEFNRETASAKLVFYTFLPLFIILLILLLIIILVIIFM